MLLQKSNINPSLRFVNVDLGYSKNQKLLTGVNLSLENPGLIHFIGKNGSGKSTIVEAISGYLPTVNGEIYVCQHNAKSRFSREYRTICRSDPSLHYNLSIKDHLTIISKLYNVNLEIVLERAKKFGISSFFEKRIEELSTGTKKKLWFLLNTIDLKEIIILDEPFNGVDIDSIKIMVKEINTWKKDSIVLLISHILPENIEIDRSINIDYL